MKEKEKQSKALYILYIDRYYIYDLITLDARVYIETYFQPSKLRNLMVGGLQGEEWKFIQKYLKKNIQKSRWKISGSFRNHFAGENGVCEISQTPKRAAKYFRINKLNSQDC